MKKWIIFYAVFTCLWPLFLFVFEEKTRPLSVLGRISFLYFWIAMVLTSIIVLLMTMRKNERRYSLLLALLILINVVLMVMNPFALVTNFFG